MAYFTFRTIKKNDNGEISRILFLPAIRRKDGNHLSGATRTRNSSRCEQQLVPYLVLLREGFT